jgi:hypothetical protein
MPETREILALLLAVVTVGAQSLGGTLYGLQRETLGCRWVDETSSSNGTRVRTCFTSYHSTSGVRARKNAMAAAAHCRLIHTGWLASIPNADVQSWLEEMLNLKYVSLRPTHSLQLIGEFWFGARQVGIARRHWAWSDGSISGSPFLVMSLAEFQDKLRRSTRSRWKKYM